MASIKIHEDLYGFKRTRKGFTDRQISAFGIGVFVCLGTVALFGYALGVNYMVATTIGLVAAAPFIVGGVFPLFESMFGMPAEEFFQSMVDYGKRGGAISWHGEAAPVMKCEVTREYAKRKKAKGAECATHERGGAEGAGQEGEARARRARRAG